MKRFLHVIKTKSVTSDGRLLKWCKSLNALGITSQILALEDNNSANSTRVLNFEVVRTRLWARWLFGKRKGYLLKIPEYVVRVVPTCLRSDASVLIFHDVQHYLTLLVMGVLRPFHSKRIIWDLHELPHEVLLRYSVTRRLISAMVSMVDAVVVTNEERKEYLTVALGMSNTLYVVLNNYPETEFLNAEKMPLPMELDDFLKGSPYVLWMGVASEARNFSHFFDAYKASLYQTHKLVIMGGIDSCLRAEVNTYIKSGDVFAKFVGQDEIINYVDCADFSVVLYADTSPNNWLCEPNRMYQLVGRGIPVICGNNPTLKRIVGDNEIGIVLPDDGSSVDSMTLAMKQMCTNISDYRQKCVSFANLESFNWEKQFERNIAPLIETLVAGETAKS